MEAGQNKIIELYRNVASLRGFIKINVAVVFQNLLPPPSCFQQYPRQQWTILPTERVTVGGGGGAGEHHSGG